MPSFGSYYMRARWYDPEIGRFLSEDPAGAAGGTNAYVFAGDDPINGQDPSGLGDCYDVYMVAKDANGHEVGSRIHLYYTAGCFVSATGGVQGRRLLPRDDSGESTRCRSKVQCTYTQSTGHMVCRAGDGRELLNAVGYSGAPGRYKNNPLLQSVRGKGPIPVGTYTIGRAFPGSYKRRGISFFLFSLDQPTRCMADADS